LSASTIAKKATNVRELNSKGATLLSKGEDGRQYQCGAALVAGRIVQAGWLRAQVESAGFVLAANCHKVA
jgi:hypothetical protein